MIRIVRGCGRLLHALLFMAFAVGVMAVAAGIGVAWRLSQGPLDLGWAARRIEAEANAPDTPTRLVIGSATMEWGGFASGAGRGLELHLNDVMLLDRASNTMATVGKLELTVSMGRLLLGQVVPRTIAATGVSLRLLRAEDGRLSLDLGGLDLGDDNAAPGASLSESIAELARPARRDDAPAPPALRHLEQLQRVQLTDSVLRLQDRKLGGAWRLALSALDLRRQAGGGMRGTAAATWTLGAAQTTLALQADVAPGGGTQLQLAMSPIAAAAMQQAATDQGAVDQDLPELLDAAVQGSAGLLLSPELRPVRVTVHAEAGTGRMRVAGATIGFDSLALDLAAAWDQPAWTRPSSLAVPRAKAVLHAPGGAWPTTVAFSGQLQALDGRIAGTAEGTLDHLAFSDIAALWPARLGGHVRPWLVPNIPSGTARDATIKVGFDAAADFSDVKLRTIDGSVAGEDLTIYWLKPVQPIEHVQALLTIKNPDYLDIVVPTARQGAAQLKDGTIRITGLSVKDQFLALNADVTGGVPELITLLKHPTLRLLDRKPIPMRNPGGAFAGRLAINLPLNDDLDFDDVKIKATGRMTDLRLGGLVAGRDLERGDIQIEASSEALKASGPAVVAGIQSDLVVEMDFKGGPPSQVVQRAQAAGRATPRQLATAGLDAGALMQSGTGLFVGKYTQRRDMSADLVVTGDLRDAGLGLGAWRKAPGLPADISAKVLLRGDRMLGIDQLRAQGPGMAVEGHAEMVGAKPLLLVLDRIVLGATRARGQVRLPAGPNEPIRATIEGTVLDLSAELAKKSGPAPAQADTPWVADVRFDRVLLSGERGMSGVVAHAENDGRRLAALRATSTGAERMDASIKPEGGGRRLTVRAADGGAVLRAFDLVDTVQGGALALDALYDDTKPSSPLTGTAGLTDFHTNNARILGKLLQAVTLYGVVDAVSGPGLAFSEATMPFKWDGGVLEVTDARAFSASLGLTARGRIDAERKTIDLQGTLVPAYVLNSMLGRIPLLGRLFSAERGGGLIAVNYSLRGPVANPSVLVNPLSALTPGFLRGLFHILD